MQKKAPKDSRFKLLIGAVIVALVAMIVLIIQDGRVDALEIGNIVNALVVLSAFAALRSSNDNLSRQLKVEQQPLIVVTEPIIVEELLSSAPPNLMIKNIGRGPALGVRFSFTSDAVMPIFEANQPNSVDLAAGEEKRDWRVQAELLKSQVAASQDSFFLYNLYTDQLGNHYHGRTRFSLENGVLKILQNELT